MGAISGKGGGDSDSIAVLHVWPSSLRSKVVDLSVGNLSSQQATGRKCGGIPCDLC